MRLLPLLVERVWPMVRSHPCFHHGLFHRVYIWQEDSVPQTWTLPTTARTSSKTCWNFSVSIIRSSTETTFDTPIARGQHRISFLFSSSSADSAISRAKCADYSRKYSRYSVSGFLARCNDWYTGLIILHIQVLCSVKWHRQFVFIDSSSNSGGGRRRHRRRNRSPRRSQRRQLLRRQRGRQRRQRKRRKRPGIRENCLQRQRTTIRDEAADAVPVSGHAARQLGQTRSVLRRRPRRVLFRPE